jgi:quinol monooxygenase YgiN
VNNKDTNESSIAANVKGIQAPAAPLVRRKLSEADFFEALAAYCDMTGQDIDEVVRKKGDLWAIYDDNTGVEKGVFEKRKEAWKRQRMLRSQQKIQKQHNKKVHNQGKKAQTGSKPKQAVKPGSAKKAQKPYKSGAKRENKENLKEQFLNAFKAKVTKALKEGSALSYVFEQNPASKDTVYWEHFLDKLSHQTILSDPKLKKILEDMAKSEVQLLSRAVNAIKRVLSQHFKVEQGEVDQDESGDLILTFSVYSDAHDQAFEFAVKIDNGRPLIQFPPETTSQLNSSPDETVRQLKAYLMFAQEDSLDKMNDVVNLTTERDSYLQELLGQADEVLGNLDPLRITMLKFLLRSKYRGVK